MKKVLMLVVLLFTINSTVCSAAYFTFKMVAPIANESMKYEDETIYATFILPRKNPSQMMLSIYNKTDQVITLDWSKVALIFRGKSYTVVSGSQLTSKVSNSSSSASIPPKTSYEESVFVERNIEYVERTEMISGGIGSHRRGWGGWIGIDDLFGGATTRGKWQVKPFFTGLKDDDVEERLLGYKLGIYLPLLVQEKDVEYRFDFVIDYVSSKQSPGNLGILVADKNEVQVKDLDYKMQQGVVITHIYKKSVAKKADLDVGDNILKIDNTIIKNTEDFMTILNSKQAKDEITITYFRKGKGSIVQVKLAKF